MQSAGNWLRSNKIVPMIYARSVPVTDRSLESMPTMPSERPEEKAPGGRNVGKERAKVAEKARRAKEKVNMEKERKEEVKEERKEAGDTLRDLLEKPPECARTSSKEIAEMETNVMRVPTSLQVP